MCLGEGAWSQVWAGKTRKVAWNRIQKDLECPVWGFRLHLERSWTKGVEKDRLACYKERTESSHRMWNSVCVWGGAIGVW